MILHTENKYTLTGKTERFYKYTYVNTEKKYIIQALEFDKAGQVIEKH